MSLFGENRFGVSKQDKTLKIIVYISMFVYCGYIGYSMKSTDFDSFYPAIELLIPMSVFFMFQSYYSNKYGYIYNKGHYITRDEDPGQFNFWMIVFRVCAVALPLTYIYFRFF